MFNFSYRSLISVVKNVTQASKFLRSNNIVDSVNRSHSALASVCQRAQTNELCSTNNVCHIPSRGVKKVIHDAAEPHRQLMYHPLTGKRTTVTRVLESFYRLHWGGWIRTRVGKNKKLSFKTNRRLRKLRQHVFCSSNQSRLFDRMVVDPQYKRRRYFIDDPYEPYQEREEFKLTRTKPLPPAEEDYRLYAV